MKRGRLLVFVGFGLAAAGGLAAYAYLSFEQPPGFSELPQSWFVRPATVDPADWRLAGAPTIEVTTPSGANLEIIPEDRADIQASLAGPAGLKPYPIGKTADGPIVLAGAVKLPCPAQRSPDAPTLILHTPRSVIVRAEGRFAATVGAAQNLMIDSDGCATWKIASARTLWIAERRGASSQAGPTVDLRLARWGPGADRIASVARSADLIVHGRGSVALQHADGIVDAAIWGRGRIEIGDGFVGREQVWIKGSGELLHRGGVGEFTGEARMGGKIRVRQAAGVITGQGDVEVGRPKAPVTGF